MQNLQKEIQIGFREFPAKIAKKDQSVLLQFLAAVPDNEFYPGVIEGEKSGQIGTNGDVCRAA